MKNLIIALLVIFSVNTNAQSTQESEIWLSDRLFKGIPFKGSVGRNLDGFALYENIRIATINGILSISYKETLNGDVKYYRHEVPFWAINDLRFLYPHGVEKTPVLHFVLDKNCSSCITISGPENKLKEQNNITRIRIPFTDNLESNFISNLTKALDNLKKAYPVTD